MPHLGYPPGPLLELLDGVHASARASESETGTPVVVHLWTWPGDDEALVRSLLRLDRVVEHGALEQSGRGGGRSGFEGRTDHFGLVRLEEMVEPDSQLRWPDIAGPLVIVGGPRPLAWPHAVPTVRPERLTVRPRHGKTSIEQQALELTGGWLGPASILVGAAEPGRPPEAWLAEPTVLERLRERALGPLGACERELLFALAASSLEIELEHWRQALVEEPEALVGLERLLRAWGYLLPGPAAGKAHLPPFLRLLLRRSGENRATGEAASATRISRLVRGEHLSSASHGARGVWPERAGDGREPGPSDALSSDPLLSNPLSPDLLSSNPLARADERADEGDSPEGAKRGGGGREIGSVQVSTERTEGWSLRLLGPPIVHRLALPPDATTWLPGGSTRVEAIDPAEALGLPSEEVSWRLHRALHCVAYLALAPGRRATKDELVNAIWSESRPDAVRRNFHPTLSEARRSLVGKGKDRGQGILYRHGYYMLDPERVWWTDRDHFLALLDLPTTAADTGEEEGEERLVAELESSTAAWKLYRGPLLEGLDADWILPIREQLYGNWVELLRRIGKLATRLGRRRRALDAYRSLLLAEPFEEPSHLAIMEIYGQQRRRDLVRHQFLRLQDALKELGVEPAPETLDRYHELMG